MRIIDTHCHLTFEGLAENAAAVIGRSRTAGVTGNTNVMKNDGGLTFDQARWGNWTVPALQ